MNDARRAVEAVWRSESARIVGALARYTRDFALAEDVAQEALAEAIVNWSTGGVALTLRVVGGLTTDEIANSCLVPVPTIQARITRAKKTIAAARIPFAVPGPADRPARLSSVLTVVYLIFTEGSSASHGDSWIRTDLAQEALRLCRSLTRLTPEPEVQSLLALMELTAARFPARVDAGGRPVLLENQDRHRWDHSAIRRGRAALAQAVAAGRGLGFYGLQASIAECHAIAPTVDETNWDRIVILYEALSRLAPSPVIDLNRAAAVAMASGPAAGLQLVDDLADGVLGQSHLLYAVRAGLLARLGRPDAARAAYLQAAALCGNAAERETLEDLAAAQ